MKVSKNCGSGSKKKQIVAMECLDLIVELMDPNAFSEENLDLDTIDDDTNFYEDDE